MDKIRLLDQLARSRGAIQTGVKSLQDELNFRQKAADAIRSKPMKWLGGAALSGYFFAKLRGNRKPKPLRRPKAGEAVVTEARRAGVWAGLLGLLRLLAPVLRPVVMSYASRALSKYASRS